MDDDFEFDDSLLQAIDRLEHQHNSQVAASRHQHAQEATTSSRQNSAQQRQQQAGRQPLQQADHSSNNSQMPWSLFCTVQPGFTDSTVASVCSGWATRRCQRMPRFRAGAVKSSDSIMGHAQAAEQQSRAAGKQQLQHTFEQHHLQLRPACQQQQPAQQAAQQHQQLQQHQVQPWQQNAQLHQHEHQQQQYMHHHHHQQHQQHNMHREQQQQHDMHHEQQQHVKHWQTLPQAQQPQEPHPWHHQPPLTACRQQEGQFMQGPAGQAHHLHQTQPHQPQLQLHHVNHQQQCPQHHNPWQPAQLQPHHTGSAQHSLPAQHISYGLQQTPAAATCGTTTAGAGAHTDQQPLNKAPADMPGSLGGLSGEGLGVSAAAAQQGGPALAGKTGVSGQAAAYSGMGLASGAVSNSAATAASGVASAGAGPWLPPAAAASAAQQNGLASGPGAGCSGLTAAGSGMGAAAGAVPGGSCAAAGVSGAGAAAGSGGPARTAAPVFCTAKLHLGPKGTIEVEFSSCIEAICSICGSIPGARQVGERWSKKWHIPADKIDQLEAKLKDCPSLHIPKFEPLADVVCKVTSAARKQPDDSERFDCLSQLQLAPGESLQQRMMPFQREGVKFGLRAGGRVLIGDEMGLGKTVQACALAKCYQDEWPALIVAPSSLRLSWQAALYDWIRIIEDRVLVVLRRTDMTPLATAASEEEARGMYDFIVVSYDMLKDMKDVLEAMEFKVVILDESHCIKNPTALRTKLALPLVKKAVRCFMLSGTPALSRPTELFTQLQGLLPKAALTKKAFEDRYAIYSTYTNFPKLTGSKNEDELNKLLTSTVMIRRKKQEVMKDLPAKLRKQVLLMLPPKKREQLSNLKHKLNEVRQLTADIHGLGHEGVGGGLLQGMQQEQRTMIMGLYHATASIKADAVGEYVVELLENAHPDDKFLVFAYHKEMMDAIERAVSNVQRQKEFKGMQHMRIDGSTPPQQRQRNVEKFQENENCRVAILNIKAAGVGLTLTRASTVVFAELAWTPSEVQQAEDRAHRIGQTNCVNVQLLLVKDSIDEIMWELLQNKLATTGQVLDGQKDRMEVDKAAQHRTKGGWAASQMQSPQNENQPSIKEFFGGAPKKQRVK